VATVLRRSKGIFVQREDEKWDLVSSYPLAESSDETYDVERILGFDGQKYLIKWVDDESFTWEPKTNLQCPE
jgi:hypothetical protein